MYVLRMSEALETDYPALAHFLGEKRWATLVRGYVLAHPSRSYTLNVLGRSLPDWLREAEELPRRGFCHDLARLEWAVTEAFDAEETPRLTEAELAAMPPEAWDAARLVPSAALRLVELRWNANEWLDSTKDDRHDHPKPRRRDAWVGVFRQGYAVYRRELSRPAYRLLSDLTAGLAVGEALAAALARRGAPGPEALTRWFQQWAADGLFPDRADPRMTGLDSARRARALALKVAGTLSFLAPLLTRLVIGQAYYQTGSGKIANFGNVVSFFTDLGIPFPEVNAFFVSRLEFWGGLLLVIGLFTRVVAGLLASSMVVALATADRQSFLEALRGTGDAGLTDVVSFVYLLFLIWLVLSGPGAASLDALLVRWLERARRQEGERPAAQPA
jgi:putative oxidoreductase